MPKLLGHLPRLGELTKLQKQVGIEEIDKPAAPSEAAMERDAMSAHCSRCEQGKMRPVTTRFGVTLDTCSGCGGVFLDQGEFGRMVEALNALIPPPQT